MENHHHVAVSPNLSKLTVSERVSDFFSQYGFMPHGHCYLWKPWLVGIHVVSDFLIGAAYFVISITLYFLVKRTNLGFNKVVLCFGVFIGACGLTHFMEIWNLWNADYWLAGWLKVITALASVFTGVYLFKLREPIIAFADAARMSERHRLDLEALLAERTEDFNVIANSIPQLAWKADPSGHITWYNQRWYDYTGSSLKEMEGWGWEKVHHPEHVEAVTKRWKFHLENGIEWEDTFPLRKHDGAYNWFLSRARPVRDAEGKITHWFGTNTDITNQRQLTENLRETEEKLRKAVTARDEFLSIASHELKTPLTSMRLNTQILQKKLSDGGSLEPSKITVFADQMDRQTIRLNRLVDDMLDISRIETGRLSLQMKDADLALILKDIKLRFHQQFIAATGSELIYDGPETMKGVWDSDRLEQVFSNLLTNAIKYGGQKPVKVILEKKGASAIVKVIDQGPGISSELKDVIFDRFERGGVNANDISGLGLGLFISKQIVLAHHGKIWVESEPGNGSTFFVELPIIP